MEFAPASHHAAAHIRGGGVSGTVQFTQRPDGVLVSARIFGLPATNPTGFFALHIHEGNSCAGAGSHYNPSDAPHPRHSGDLPPLLSCGGTALSTVLTDRFSLRDVMGRTVVIHSGPDDFRSQPSGNPGPMLACGVIQ